MKKITLRITLSASLFTTSLSFILFSLFATLAIADNEVIPVATFSQGDLSQWEPHSFNGLTQYQLITQDKVTILKATSQKTGSGLVKRQQIDLHRTPFLNWEWKVEKALYRLSETFKEGDDFAARIYIVVDGGVFFWNTIALNYVWSSGQAKNTLWESPFTSNAKMIAVESGNQFKNQWRTEKRNVRQDMIKAFGTDYRFINAIAIMTDTDNSGQSVIAYYGDIYFSAD